MTRTPEQRSTPTSIFDRTIHRFISRNGRKETERSIWDRYPDLKKIPEGRWPGNVFIIPDGNGRWAEKFAGGDVQRGHEKGAEIIAQTFRDLSELSEHVPFVGAWGLSIDNLNGRKPTEIDFLMELFEKTIRILQPDFRARNNRFVHIGRKDVLDKRPSLRATIEEVEKDTEDNKGQTIYIAIGFSGRDQELRAAQKLADMVKTNPQIEVTEQFLESLRDGDGEIPPADLLVRTSGELRLSDVGWLAGNRTELYFIRKLFPSTGTSDTVKALVEYSKRNIRLGTRPSTNGSN